MKGAYHEHPAWGARPWVIHAAREQHQSDEVQVDDNADASPAEDGVWVQAWVWVSHEDVQSKKLDMLGQVK